MKRSVTQATIICALSMIVMGCGSNAPLASPRAPTGVLRIDWPPNGADVCTNIADAVLVSGHAPPGARVVHDISLAPDDEDVAHASGEWSIPADVRPGRNELTFRIGDDHSTEQSVEFTFKRVDAMPQPDCVDAVGVGLTPSVAPAASATATPTLHSSGEEVLSLSGRASPDGAPTERSIRLSGGDYLLMWKANEPFDAAAGSCGVSVFLFDSSGEYAGEVPGVSTLVTSAASDRIQYRDLDAGLYTVSVYVGCPWSVVLTMP